MASQPSGNKHIEMVYIDTSKITFIIKGKSKFNIHNNSEHIESDFKYRCLSQEDLISDSTVIESPYFYEYTDYEIIIINKGNHKIEFYHENKNIRDKVSSVGRSDMLFTGIINFKGDIGYSDLTIYVDGSEHLLVTLQVFPSKVDYKKDYYEILSDVNEEVYNLAFEFLKRTYSNTKLVHKNNSSLTEYYSILTYVYDKMMKALKVVLERPHHMLQKEREVVNFHKIRNVDNHMIKWLEKRPQNLIKKGNTYLPIQAEITKKRVTFDTTENRYLKYMMCTIINKLNEIKKRYSKYSRSEDVNFTSKIDKMILEINSSINRSFLKSIGTCKPVNSTSLVFTMAAGYRDIYKYYLMLKKGLTLNGEVFRLSMKDLALLYEYWCFIKINALLKKKYRLVRNDIIKVERDGVFVRLKKGKTAKVTYENPRNGERFTIAYNSKMTSKTIAQKPDNVLSIEKTGSDIKYSYIFDAKYKIDTAGERNSYRDYSKTPGPKEEDINTMHRYRDAIIYENKDEHKFQKEIFGAFVLFPYNNEEEYRNHKFYKSIEEVNIGGIPFLPSSTNLMEDFLDELIEESSLSSFERAIEQRGKEWYLKDSDFKERNVLVGSLRNNAQLDINLKHRFYHIPLENINLNKNIVNTISLAQSKTIFKDEAGIKYYGNVKEINIVKRSDIKEIPKDSDELYVRFEIDEWKTLERTIEVKGYQVRKHIYTTEYLLYNAETVSELCIKSEEEFRLWMELKNLQNEVAALIEHKKVIENTSSIKGFSFGNKEIYFAGDKIKVISGDSICEFSRADLRKRPAGIVRDIRNVL